MAKITKRFLDALKPPENGEASYWDDGLKGFGVRIRYTGRITFILMYRNAQGRQRKYTLGEYGKLTPAEARDMARQLLADAARGLDPVETRVEKRTALTLNELAERYLEEHAKLKKKPRSVKEDKRLLNDVILPVLGKLGINDISQKDIAKFHHRQSKTPTQANRSLSLLSKMFNLSVAWGLRPAGPNPCGFIERFREKKRERYLSTDELARLGAVLNQAEQAGKELPGVITAIRLLLFTGARLSEILELKWEHFDREIGVLRLPDSKTGSKIILLGRPALEVLEAAPRMAGNPYVCPGVVPGKHLVGLPKAWRRIRETACLEDVRLHDLRHSFASVGAGAGLGLPVIGGLLGHTQAATTQRYAHLATDPLKRAADDISARIDQAMKAKTKQPGKVIDINNHRK